MLFFIYFTYSIDRILTGKSFSGKHDINVSPADKAALVVARE